MKTIIFSVSLAVFLFCQVDLRVSAFGYFLKVEFGNYSQVENLAQDTSSFESNYCNIDTTCIFITEQQPQGKKIVDDRKFLYDTIAKVPNDKVVLYIQENQDACIKSWDKGVLPSVKMAQAIIESASGTSEICQNTNNHFGIRCFDCDTTYKGYRFYQSKEHCFKSHNWVFKSPRFCHLLGNKSIEDWATQLQSCYYASDTTYTNALIYNIMLYDLYRLDEIAFCSQSNI